MVVPTRLLVLLSLLSSRSVRAAHCHGLICDPSSESCCEDALGSECCLSASTSCVAPRGRFATSTCCARWSIGCSVGSVGCCDPARAWQFLGPQFEHQLNATILDRAPQRRRALFPPQARDAGPSSLAMTEEIGAGAGAGVAFALFTRAMTSELVAATVDLKSGGARYRVVTGPAADYYKSYAGEATRLFPFDPSACRFFLLDLDLTKGKLAHPLVLYTVNASSGTSDAVEVHGCGPIGDPVGQAWDEMAGNLLVAGQTSSHANFCSIRLSPSVHGTPIGSIARGADETSASRYSAYLSHVSGGVAFRLGYLRASEGMIGGLGITSFSQTDSFLREGTLATGEDDSSSSGATPPADIVSSTGKMEAPRVRFRGRGEGSIATATMQRDIEPFATSVGQAVWLNAVMLSTHGLPTTLVPHPDGGFLSLAPRTDKKHGGKLDILRWSHGIGSSLQNERIEGESRLETGDSSVAFGVNANASRDVFATPIVFARLANARYPPLGLLGSGVLGYVGDASNGRDTYAALTVEVRGGPLGLRDRWTISRLDLSNSQVVDVPLNPQPAALGAQACALSGFGIV